MSRNIKVILTILAAVMLVLFFVYILNISDKTPTDEIPEIATSTPNISTSTPVVTKPDPSPVNPNPTPESTPTPAPQPNPTPGPTPVSSTEISRLPGNSKRVAFTFDGGSGSQSADKILSVLQKHNLTSTFFLTGKYTETNPAYVTKFNNAGHEIFNHTYSHPDLTTLSENEIKEQFAKTETIIKGITSRSTMPYFRPPYGARNTFVRETAASAGYQDVYWTVDAFDWRENDGWDEEMVKKRILDNLAPGNIYLMHIGDNITGNILDEVFTEVESRGYEIVSLSEGLK